MRAAHARQLGEKSGPSLAASSASAIKTNRAPTMPMVIEAVFRQEPSSERELPGKGALPQITQASNNSSVLCGLAAAVFTVVSMLFVVRS